MERKCDVCGFITNDENARFCERCGSALPKSESEIKQAVSPMVEVVDIDEINRERIKQFNRENRKKKLFVLAFVGLLLDFIFGIGWFMCLPVAICASVDAGQYYKTRKKITTWHLWALVVGYIGTIFGLAFFVLMLL